MKTAFRVIFGASLLAISASVIKADSGIDNDISPDASPTSTPIPTPTPTPSPTPTPHPTPMANAQYKWRLQTSMSSNYLSGIADIGSFSLDAVPNNSVPSVPNANVTTWQNVPETFPLPTVDADGDALSFNMLTQPRHGAVSFNPATPSIATYVPANGFSGYDAFAYAMDDSKGAADVGVALVTVNAPAAGLGGLSIRGGFRALSGMGGDPIIAININRDTNYNTPVTFSVVIPGIPSPTLTIVQNPVAHGTLTAASGQFTYRPDSNFAGVDTPAVIVAETSGGLAAIAIVTINVGLPPVTTTVQIGNMAPIAFSGTGTTMVNGIDTTVFPDGSVPVNFIALDLGGQGAQGAATILVDNTPPDLCIYRVPGTPAQGSFKNGRVNLEVLAKDKTSGVQFVQLRTPTVQNYVFGQGVIDPNYPTAGFYSIVNYNAPALADGPYNFLTFCVDRANNITQAATDFSIDNTAPTGAMQLTPLVAGSLVPGGLELVEVNAEDGIGIGLKDIGLYLVNGANATLINLANASPLNFNLNTMALADGLWRLRADLQDLLGQKSSVVKNFTVDKTAPTIAISAPVNGAVIDGSLSQMTAAVTDLNGVASKTILIDGAAVSFTQTLDTYTFPAVDTNGIHTVTLRAVDAVGNQGEETHRFVITGGINNGNSSSGFLSGNFYTSGGTILFYAVDPLDPVVSVSGGVNGGLGQAMVTLGNGIYSYQIGSLPQGPFTFQVTITNASGQSSSNIQVFVIDDTPPTITSFTPNGSSPLTGVTPVQMMATDGQGLAKLEMYLSNSQQPIASQQVSGGAATLPYQLDTTPLTDGIPYTLRAVALDQAGNRSELSRSVVVSNGGNTGTAPSIQILSPANNQVVGQIINLKMQVTGENILSAGFSIDGRPLANANNTAPGIYEALWDTSYYLDDPTVPVVDGGHVISFIAVNAAGAAPVKTATVRVDNTPPSIISITRPQTDQTLFLTQNLIADASDGAFPLQSVTFRIGAQDKAFFQGNANPSNTQYVYAFDTEETTSTGEPVYPDNSYTLLVIATDLAGNTAQQPVPFLIDNANVPTSDATVTWTPSDAFVVGPENTLVTAAIANATVDATLVGASTLKVFSTKDGVRSQLSGVVQLTGNTVRFIGSIPYNARISCVLSAIDTDGKLIRQTRDFVSGMDRALGGNVKYLVDNLLTFSIPQGALPVNAFVEIAKLDVSQSPPASEGDEIAYGPFELVATDASGSRLAALNSTARLDFSRSASQIPPAQQGSFIDRAEQFVNGAWLAVGNNSSAIGATAAAPGARTISVPVQKFGIYRITTAAAPGSGITELFNYPNPFSPSEGGTTISFLLGQATRVNMRVYDLLGNLVIDRDWDGAFGQNTFVWNGRNGKGEEIANGGYIALFETAEGAKAKRKMGVAK